MSGAWQTKRHGRRIATMARARVPGLVQGGRGGPDQVVEKLLVIVAVDPQATLRYSLHCCSFPLWRAPRNWALSACLSCLSNYGPMEPCEWPNVQYCRSIIDRVSCPYVPFCLLCLGPKAPWNLLLQRYLAPACHWLRRATSAKPIWRNILPSTSEPA